MELSWIIRLSATWFQIYSDRRDFFPYQHGAIQVFLSLAAPTLGPWVLWPIFNISYRSPKMNRKVSRAVCILYIYIITYNIQNTYIYNTYRLCIYDYICIYVYYTKSCSSILHSLTSPLSQKCRRRRWTMRSWVSWEKSQARCRWAAVGRGNGA